MSHQLNQNQNQKINKDDLHPKEEQLIRLIREQYRFGRIVVITHDGLPQKIEETVRFHAL